MTFDYVMPFPSRQPYIL